MNAALYNLAAERAKRASRITPCQIAMMPYAMFAVWANIVAVMVWQSVRRT